MEMTLDSVQDCQRRLYAIRNYFLNGPSDDTFPRDPRDSGWNRIEQYFLDQVVELRKQLRSFANEPEINTREGSWNEVLAECERLSVTVWSRLRSALEVDIEEHRFSINEARINESEAARYFESFAQGVAKDLRDFDGLTLLAHGSYGDGTALYGISDIDLAAFVSTSLLTSPQRLKALACRVRSNIWPRLLRIDFEQHHGIFFFSESDLENWNEQMLPLTCLKRAASLKEEITCKVALVSRKPLDDLSRVNLGAKCLDHFEVYFRNYESRKIDSLFELKYVNQNLLLFPAIFHAAIRGPSYKPDAINWLKSVSGELSLPNIGSVVERAEELRTRYREIEKSTFLQSQSGSLRASILTWGVESKYRELRIRQRTRQVDDCSFDSKVTLVGISELKKRLRDLVMSG